MQVTPRFPGVVREHAQAPRRQGQEGRGAGHGREQPEPHDLRAEGADRRHGHRPRQARWASSPPSRSRCSPSPTSRPCGSTSPSIAATSRACSVGDAVVDRRRGRRRRRSRPRSPTSRRSAAATRRARSRAPSWPTTAGCGPACSSTGRVLLSARSRSRSPSSRARCRRWRARPSCSCATATSSRRARSSSAQRDADWVEITFGVLPGDVYAAKNSFVIKAEIGKASAAHEH